MNGTLEKEIALNNFQLVVAHGTDAPIERSGHRIFADEDYIYMVGGYNPNPERTLTDAWRFNRLTQEWQQCTLANPASPLPDTLASFSLVSRGHGPDFNCGSNEAYFYGGTKVPFGGESNTNRFYWIKIDKTGRVHLQLQSINGEEPLPRMYGQGMCRRIEQNTAGRLREVIYIVGGTTGHEYNMDVWKLQRPANAQQNEAWHLTRLNRRIPDEFGRYRLELVPHGQLLFSFGGSISDQYFIRLDELTAFNLSLNEFEQIKTKPDPNHGYPRERSCHSLVHQGNMVYLCGGRDMEMTIFDTIWRFNLETLQWTQLNTGLSIPVFFNSAAITPDGCIFVFGGVTIDPTNRGLPKRVNQLQRMWLQPPSLHFIASEVVLKNISSERIHQLTAEGVRLSDVLMLVHRILQNEPNSNSSDENHQPILVPIDGSSSPPNSPFQLNQLLPLFYSPYFLFFQVLVLAVLWSFVSSLLTRFDLNFL